MEGIEGTEYIDKIHPPDDQSDNSWETVDSSDGEDDDEPNLSSESNIDHNEEQSTQMPHKDNLLDEEKTSKTEDGVEEMEDPHHRPEENIQIEDNSNTLAAEEKQIEDTSITDNGEKENKQIDIHKNYDEDDKPEPVEGDDAISDDEEKNPMSDGLSKGEISQSQPSEPRLEVVKILSDEDWEKLRYIKEHQKELEQKGVITNSKKRKIQDVEDDVDVDSIIGYRKKKRMSKQERLKHIRDSKEESQEMRKNHRYGAKKQGASTTNIEKRKNKPYTMLRQKALEKQRRSINQKLRIKEKHIRKLASQKLDHH